MEDVDRKTRVEEITTGCVAESGQDGVVIEIDFDPNRIEIEVNGEDYDLPIGQNQHIPYREIRLMRLCKHSCRTVMTMWNATGTLN